VDILDDMGVSKLSEKVLFLKVNYFFKGIVHLKNLQLFGYPYSLKYLILCSAEERNPYRFETT